MSKYQKRPIIVEASQFTHPATAPIGVKTREDGTCYVITIHKDEIDVFPSDWIVLENTPSDPYCGVLAYPIKNDVFVNTYDPITEYNDNSYELD